MLFNFGNAPLDLPIPATGNNPSISPSFLLNSSVAGACPLVTSGSANPGTLEAGAECALPISFEPMTTGLITGQLVFTDNSMNHNAPLNAHTAIELSGVGLVQPTPTVTLFSLENPSFVQNVVSFVATVGQSASTVPTGTITFYDGTTSLGAVPLNAGVATLNISTLAIGSHTITADYSGDPVYKPANSTALSEVIEDFTLTTTAPGVPIVKAGGTIAIPFSITMVAPATTLPTAITLVATGAPNGSSYTFTPSGVAAGEGATTGTLTITVPVNYVASDLRPMKPGSKLPVVPLALAFLLLPMAATMRKAGKRLGRMMALVLLAIAGMTATSALIGCGANKAAPYEVTVTASSGSLSYSSTFTITVESR